jgi:phosphopantothenoylcysteine synthetase/decarboxylase
MTRNGNRPIPAFVLYLIACGAPPARYVGQLATAAQAAGWDVCIVITPDALKFVDAPALYALTGHPVRSTFKQPGDLDILPDPDAMIVAPMTVNTTNKWSAGIADTLALALLVEGLGKGLPIVAMPFTNSAMAAHPAFDESIARLRTWGVRVMFGPDVLALHEPGTGEGLAANFPWHRTLDALHDMRTASPRRP